VSWKIPKETNPESMPFFFCETYEVGLIRNASSEYVTDFKRILLYKLKLGLIFSSYSTG
jgi:hypothetical protein